MRSCHEEQNVRKIAKQPGMMQGLWTNWRKAHKLLPMRQRVSPFGSLRSLRTRSEADRPHRRLILWCRALGGALALSCLVSCSSQPTVLPANLQIQQIQVKSELAPEQEINRHIAGDPRTLDPTLATDVVGQTVLDDLFEGLTAPAEDGRIIPGVATSWETSSDGKTWTFHLRSDAKWSNGQPLTAGDFVYAWRRLADPGTGAEYAQALTAVENAVDITGGKMPVAKLGVEAPDPHTFIVHLNAPVPYLLGLVSNMYLYPIYEPAVKQWGDDWTQAGHMVSDGAFMLSDRVNNGHTTMLKNPYYWDAKQVRLSKVTYYPLSDYAAAMYQYLAGSLDFTDRISLQEKERLQRLLGDQVVLAPYFSTSMFAYNLTKPPFANNPKLRRALNLAIDRDIIVTYEQHGVGVPAFDVMPPLPGYEQAIPDWAKLSNDERHAMARKLYHEAGYSDSHPLETVITYQNGGSDNRRLVEALSAMWQTNLGAKVQIYSLEWKALLQARQMKQPILFWYAWSGDYPDPLTFMEIFKSGDGNNNMDYRSPQFDALLDQAGQINDQAIRYRLFHQAENILNEDAPVLPVYFTESHHLIKPYVKGWQSNLFDRHRSRYMYILAHQES